MVRIWVIVFSLFAVAAVGAPPHDEDPSKKSRPVEITPAKRPDRIPLNEFCGKTCERPFTQTEPIHCWVPSSGSGGRSLAVIPAQATSTESLCDAKKQLCRSLGEAQAEHVAYVCKTDSGNELERFDAN